MISKTDTDICSQMLVPNLYNSAYGITAKSHLQRQQLWVIQKTLLTLTELGHLNLTVDTLVCGTLHDQACGWRTRSCDSCSRFARLQSDPKNRTLSKTVRQLTKARWNVECIARGCGDRRRDLRHYEGPSDGQVKCLCMH